MQTGFLGLQISDPKSIMASLKWPASFSGIIFKANSENSQKPCAEETSKSSAKTRDKTR